MMEEDYVDPAGGKPDVERDCEQVERRTMTRSRSRSREEEEEGDAGKWARGTFRIPLVDVSRRAESAGCFCASSFSPCNFGANIFSSSASRRPAS